MSETFLNYIDEDSVNETFNTTDSNAEYFLSISNSVLTSYTSELDVIMQDITTDIISVEYPPDPVLEICVCIK
jgi:hypothetical protein